MTTATAGCPPHGLGPGGLPLALPHADWAWDLRRAGLWLGIGPEGPNAARPAPRGYLAPPAGNGQRPSRLRTSWEVCAGALARRLPRGSSRPPVLVQN